MPEEIRLWARASVDGETVVYCPATRELALYADDTLVPLLPGQISADTLGELTRARPDLAEFRGAFYRRAEQGRGWAGPEIEYYRGTDGQILQDVEVPLEVRKGFGDKT